MKKKKRLLNILMAAMVFSCLSASVFAAGTTTYTLDDLYMSVDIPGDMAAFTRTIDPNDPNLQALGVDSDALTSYYRSMNIYLNAMAADYGCEIVITMIENEGSQGMFDIGTYSDKKLEEIANQLPETDEVKNSGINYTNTEIYSQEDLKFLVMDFWQEMNGVKAYGCQYYTIHNGQSINLTMHSYRGELTDEQRNLLRDVVDSVSFTKTLENPNAGGFSNISAYLIIGVFIIAACLVILFSMMKRKQQKEAFRRETEMAQYHLPPENSGDEINVENENAVEAGEDKGSTEETLDAKAIDNDATELEDEDRGGNDEDETNESKPDEDETDERNE